MFQLSQEQIAFQERIRTLAQTHIKSLAAEIDRDERFPHENIALLADAGFMGCNYPAQYGGGGLDTIAYVLGLEEVAKVCGATGSIVATHGLSMYCISRYGTQAQKDKYLPLTVQGHLMGFALTEPDVGSDTSALSTTAVRDGENYIINGAKMFISSAPANECHIVITTTGKDCRGKKEFTAFIVDKDTPGVSVGSHIRKMGIHGSLTAELVFEDVVVPASQMLGQLGDGLRIALSSLDVGRIHIGTQALGIAQGAIDETITLIQKRMEMSSDYSDFQNAQFTLAELQTKVDAGRLLLWRAAWLKDQGLPFGKEAAMDKLYNSDIAVETTGKCINLLGEIGGSRELSLERMMRDAKITQIYEGTNEIQKMVIGRAIGIK